MRFDATWALRVIGRQDVHPHDVLAVSYRTRRHALIYAIVNWSVFRLSVLGMAEMDPLGWIVVLDLRPALARQGIPPTPVQTP